MFGLNWIFAKKQNVKRLNEALNQERKMKAFIRPVGQKAGLFYANGDLIQTYSRERDATRGATRRGLSLIPVA